MPNPLRHYNDCACGKRKARKSDLCRTCSQSIRHEGIPIGTPFGKLKVDGPPERVRDGTYYLCKCDCGNFRRVRNSELKASVRSCRACGVMIKRNSISESLKRVRRQLNPMQEILYQALVNPTRMQDADARQVEWEAYQIAISSKDPIADLKFFFGKHRVEYPTACSGLNNSSKPDRGHRRGQVASRIGG